MDYFVRMAIAEDMIGIATTNALPTMAPWGGVEKIVGLNPIGIGIPGGSDGPIVLDVALGATAHGKIRVYHQKGNPIPEGWAFDTDGQPTTDAAAALDGLIQPIGAFKGLGLAVCMGILSSLLSGAGYGTESGNMVDGATPGADGQFYMAINVAATRVIAGRITHQNVRVWAKRLRKKAHSKSMLQNLLHQQLEGPLRKARFEGQDEEQIARECQHGGQHEDQALVPAAGEQEHRQA